jgi:hypothetical protein
MHVERNNPRYQSFAHVWIPEVLEGECFLKNISVTGCCVECAGVTGIQPNTRYELNIKPEGASHIGSFEIQVECKWVRGDDSSTEIGFCIIASPKGKQFQNYVDYLAYYHNSHS